MTNNQALIKRTDTNGNGIAPHVAPEQKPTAPRPAVQPLTEEMVNELLAGRGFRGWLRAARVARVLGLFSLYLYLDGYDIRANFKRKLLTRRQSDSLEQGFAAQLSTRAHHAAEVLLDKFIRALRFLVFRGAEGSTRKDQRLAKQAAWLRKSLTELGPTFIKIGQALGTRADLLPLAYVKELATLQDQVPAYSTADAFARIESDRKSVV